MSPSSLVLLLHRYVLKSRCPSLFLPLFLLYMFKCFFIALSCFCFIAIGSCFCLSLLLPGVRFYHSLSPFPRFCMFLVPSFRLVALHPSLLVSLLHLRPVHHLISRFFLSPSIYLQATRSSVSISFPFSICFLFFSFPLLLSFLDLFLFRL